jgi:hypothetical protein
MTDVDLKPWNGSRVDAEGERRLVEMVLQDLRAGARVTWVSTGDTLVLGHLDKEDGDYVVEVMTIRSRGRVPVKSE